MNNHPLVTLGPELTIAYATAQRELILQALDRHAEPVSFDLQGVTEFDSAGVQLLLATAQSLRQRGQALHLQGASDVVQEGLAVFGLRGLLDTPAASAH